MVIRPAQSRDIEELVQMGHRMHCESAYAFLPYDPQKVRTLIQSYVDNTRTQCGLVAEDGHKLVGMLAGYLVEYFFCNEVVACDIVLFVEPEYRRGRAAAGLVHAFREWATRQGARELCLAISTGVHPEETGRFYEKLGF